MANLITIADIQAVIKDMSINIEEDAVTRHIEEAQELDIKPFLSRALYLAFVNGLAASPQEEIYVDLWEGKTYLDKGINANVSFKGLKYALIYYAYARMLNNHNVTVAVGGIVHKENDWSDRSDEKRIARLVTAAIAVADAYKRDCITYLNDKSTSYPLWLKENTTSNASKGGINISRVTRGISNFMNDSGRCNSCGRKYRYCCC